MLILDSSNLLASLYEKVSEIDIFCYALNMPPEVLLDRLKYNKRFKLNNATKSLDCGFSYSKRFNNTSYLYLKCFSDDKLSGDCIHHAGLKLNLDCRINTQFVEIVKHLISISDDIYQNIPKETIQNIQKDYNQYQINYRDFNYTDYNYFRKYDLVGVDVQLNYKAISNIFDVTNRRYIYYYTQLNPAYIYNTFCNDSLFNCSQKIIFPYSPTFKFLIINGGTIFEDSELFAKYNKGKDLIITKSHKDKLVLRKHLKQLNFHNFHVTNVSSESTKFDEELPLLLLHYNRVYTLYDADITGIKYTAYYKKLGIPSLLPNHGLIILNIPKEIKHIKDYTDLVCFDKFTALNILNTIINQLPHE